MALDLERLTYATVVVMAVLAAYQGWAELSFLAAALVVISPVVAVCLAHAFSELLQEHAAHRRTLTRGVGCCRSLAQLHLLLAAFSPLIILTVGRAASIEVARTGAVVQLTGMVTLDVSVRHRLQESRPAGLAADPGNTRRGDWSGSSSSPCRSPSSRTS